MGSDFILQEDGHDEQEVHVAEDLMPPEQQDQGEGQTGKQAGESAF